MKHHRKPEHRPAAAFPPKCAARSTRRPAFTIVEMLVVLGVVVTIMALVSTGLSHAAATSRGTACRSNLRQLHIAAESYLATQGGYPAAILHHVIDGGVRTTTWDFQHRPDGTIVEGPIWTHLGGKDRVFQCPDFRGDSTFGEDPSTGYNYNTTFVGAEGRYPTLDPAGNLLEGWDHCRRGIPAAAHRSPTTTALFGDGGWIGGANKFMRAPSNTVEVDLGLIHGGTQAFRHGGCANLVCLDGHVECEDLACGGVHGHEAFLETITDFPRNGFLSDDDSRYDPR